VRERRFDLHRDGRVIPGLLWTPDDRPPDEPAALVLIGHGASGDKRQTTCCRWLRRLVRNHGLAAVASMVPCTGSRAPRTFRQGRPAVAFLDFRQSWSSDPTMTDEMVADFRATVDASPGSTRFAAGGIGYWGLSMGTILGLPFVAAEPRVKAAVLGSWGRQARRRRRMPRTPLGSHARCSSSSNGTTCSFPPRRPRSFDSIGCADKRLHAARDLMERCRRRSWRRARRSRPLPRA